MMVSAVICVVLTKEQPMSAEKTTMCYAELVQTIALAVQKALKAGMSKEDVQATLTTMAELIKNAEEE